VVVLVVVVLVLVVVVVVLLLAGLAVVVRVVLRRLVAGHMPILCCRTHVAVLSVAASMSASGATSFHALPRIIPVEQQITRPDQGEEGATPKKVVNRTKVAGRRQRRFIRSPQKWQATAGPSGC
jgi:hypothetical protein